MTQQDIAFGALCAWRENRGGQTPGMQSVINVLVNRAKMHGSSVYQESVRPWQFSSMTAPGDPNLIKFPLPNDAQWETALLLMQKASEGVLFDMTDGATNYYAASMTTPPNWANTMQFTVEIAGQKFFR
jgi:N-acetylmuramoyl-L-alanine amidase